MNWQPIETAPKDREILVLNSKGVGVAKWVEEPYTPIYRPSGFQGVVCGWEAWYGGQEYDMVIDNPTHWMEMPEPPKL